MSASSRATGVTAIKDRRKAKAAADVETEVDVSLKHARWKHFAWGVIGSVIGVWSVIHLGSLGLLVGGVLVVMGASGAWSFARTLRHPPGEISVKGDSVVLPRGLCAGEPERLKVEDVSHAYLLRRSVPFMQTGPVLVVETKSGTFSYPRDWFVSEAEQRQVMRVIARKLGRL